MRYLLRNLGFYLLAFWASITLNFLLPRLMPGDPVSRMFARSQSRMQPEQIEQIHAALRPGRPPDVAAVHRLHR